MHIQKQLKLLQAHTPVALMTMFDVKLCQEAHFEKNAR